MINWKTPDGSIVGECTWTEDCARRFGSDTAPANIILLSGKYNILTANAGGALLRYYGGKTPNRRGYGFPLCAKDADLAGIMELLRQDAKERGVPFELCLCDERQKAAADTLLTVDWKTTDDDSDYIYKRESLATLTGKKLHRKRNHVNGFRRLYDGIEYRPLDGSTAADALEVAEKWLVERGDTAGDDERGELECIRVALADIDALRLFGGVLYVGDIPVAMTAASKISGSVTDVHYEKAYGEYAENGAFAVINQCFASSEAVTSEYINREEDMGIEGLRTAKNSYYPAFRVRKYYGVVRC